MATATLPERASRKARSSSEKPLEPATIHGLQHADHSLLGAQRCRDEVARAHTRLLVDARVKAPVGANVVDPDRPPAAQHLSGNAAIGREAQPSQAFGRQRVFVSDIGKEQLLRTGILQQDAYALRVQRLPAFGDHQATEILQLGTRGKGAAELVQQSQPGTVVEHRAHESATNRSGMLTTAGSLDHFGRAGSFSTTLACCRARW